MTFVAGWEQALITSVAYTKWSPQSSEISLTGSNGSDSNSTNPRYAWVFGGHQFTNTKGYADAWFTTGGVNVITQFDETSPLIGTRTITYSKTLGGLGISPEPETKAVTCGLGGTCVNKLSLTSSTKRLITKVDVLPYISCAIESGLSSDTYKHGLTNNSGWYWDTTTDTTLVYANSST